MEFNEFFIYIAVRWSYTTIIYFCCFCSPVFFQMFSRNQEKKRCLLQFAVLGCASLWFRFFYESALVTHFISRPFPFCMWHIKSVNLKLEHTLICRWKKNFHLKTSLTKVNKWMKAEKSAIALEVTLWYDSVARPKHPNATQHTVSSSNSCVHGVRCACVSTCVESMRPKRFMRKCMEIRLICFIFLNFFWVCMLEIHA